MRFKIASSGLALGGASAGALFRSALSVALLIALPVAGCSSGGQGAEAEYEENPINHVATEADLAATRSKEPLKGEAATLWVNGLGCPLCATNIDMQLHRVKGIANTNVDLSTGKVDLVFVGADRPSPQRLADAVADAGFTLVKIETR